jgi:hypothetical protein
MAAGKPLIVDDHGWYCEIPPEAALKITPGSENDLLEAMRLVVQSKARREYLGKAGERYTYGFCRPEIVAKRYVQELERFQKSIRIYG